MNSTPSSKIKPWLDGWKFRWDVVLFFAFVLAAMRNWTDLPLHELLGAMVIPVLAIHLALNWSWIVDVLRRPAKTLRGEVRFNRAWDVAQSVVAFIALGSGLLASRHLLPALGVPLGRHRLMEDVHVVTAWVLMAMIGIHLGVHAPWIWGKLRKPRFALFAVLLTLAVVAVTRLAIFREMGAFSRRFQGGSLKVFLALVPTGLIAFWIMIVLRRRRATLRRED